MFTERASVVKVVVVLLSLMLSVASSSAQDARKVLPPYVSGVFRPTSADIKKFEKKSGQAISSKSFESQPSAKDSGALSYLAGQIYEFGYGVPYNQEKAKEYYTQAAGVGYAPAQARMAWYVAAESPKNRLTALTMAKKAAEGGNSTAAINLAVMQMLGFEGGEMKQAGFKKLRELAYQGIPEAEYALGAAYLDGNIIPRDTEMAFSWLRPAGEKGQVDALMQLGYCYQQGVGVPASPELAFGYFIQAAKAGVVEGEHETGTAYLNGAGIDKDHKQAALWLRKSASLGLPESMATLGGLLATGPATTEESRQEGVLWLQKASDLGHPLAQYFLAALYLNLTGDSPYYNYAAGEALLKNSAEAGNPGAQTDLAQLLRFGTLEGMKSDKIEAAKWAYIATKNNYRLAFDLLERIRSTMSEPDWDVAKRRGDAYLQKMTSSTTPPRNTPEEAATPGVGFRY